MISSITKSKIPKDFSFVLKTSQLEEILVSENIITDVTLEYWKPQIIGSIFEVHYWLPNENNPFNRLYIRAGVIFKKDVYTARECLQKEILPEFVKWIKSIEQLEKSSSLSTKRLFTGYYKDNKVSIVKD